MTLLKRATIKSYDAGSHRAAVGISGSLSVWLDSIAISDAIAAASVVAGRECAVLFHEDDNPDDAVVISVHGGGPPGGGGGGDEIVDADSDTKVQVEESADEDKVRMDVAGTERFVLQDETPHLLLTGEQRITERLTIGDTGGTGDLLDIKKSVGTLTAGFSGLYLNPQGMALATNDNQTVNVFVCTPGVTPAAGTSGHRVRGLFFAAVVNGPGNITEVSAMSAKTGLIGYTGTITDLTGLLVPNPTILFGSPTVTRARGIWVEAFGNASITDIYGAHIGALTAGTNRRSIYVEDITAGTIARLLELQNAMYVEGSGNWTPTANQTPVIIYEGATPTARRVQWKDGASIGAGDKVMVLV